MKPKDAGLTVPQAEALVRSLDHGSDVRDGHPTRYMVSQTSTVTDEILRRAGLIVTETVFVPEEAMAAFRQRLLDAVKMLDEGHAEEAWHAAASATHGWTPAWERKADYLTAHGVETARALQAEIAAWRRP